MTSASRHVGRRNARWLSVSHDTGEPAPPPYVEAPAPQLLRGARATRRPRPAVTDNRAPAAIGPVTATGGGGCGAAAAGAAAATTTVGATSSSVAQGAARCAAGTATRTGHGGGGGGAPVVRAVMFTPRSTPRFAAIARARDMCTGSRDGDIGDAGGAGAAEAGCHSDNGACATDGGLLRKAAAAATSPADAHTPCPLSDGTRLQSRVSACRASPGHADHPAARSCSFEISERPAGHQSKEPNVVDFCAGGPQGAGGGGRQDEPRCGEE